MKPATENNIAYNFILFIQSLEDHFVTNNTSLEKEKVHRTEFSTPLIAEMVDLSAEAAISDGVQIAFDQEEAFAEELYRQLQTRPKCVNPKPGPFDRRTRCCKSLEQKLVCGRHQDCHHGEGTFC